MSSEKGEDPKDEGTEDEAPVGETIELSSASDVDEIEQTLELNEEELEEAGQQQTEIVGDEDTAPSRSQSKTLEVNLTPLRAGDSYPNIQDVAIEAVLGRGGQGVVYRGRQTYLDREVAVKVLEGGSSSSFEKRFRREAKILAGMQHPHIVSCYQAGTDDAGQCFIVMEYIGGPDLSQYISRSGALGCRDALTITRDMAVALQYAHEATVIHRDVKPQNVLLQPCEAEEDCVFPYQAKLADLGLARTAETEFELTAPGAVMGTPSTMALEQIDDPESVDFRADIYGLGCVLYHCLAGKSAYGGKPMSAIFKLKATQPPPEVRESVTGMPAGVNALVKRMMASSADARHQSYAELIEALERELDALREDGTPPPVSRKPRLLLAAGVVALALTPLWWLGDSDRPSEANEKADETVPNEAEVGGVDTKEAIEGETGPQGTASALADLLPELALDEELQLVTFLNEEPSFTQAWEFEEGRDTWGFLDFKPEIVQFRGESGSASHPLPAGSWRLAGGLSTQRPYGFSKEEAAMGGLRIEFENGHALQLRIDYAKPESQVSWAHVGPEEARTSKLAATSEVRSQAVDAKSLVSFTCDYLEGDIILQAAGAEPWKLDDDLKAQLAGPPLRFRLFGAGSLTRWEELELTGN